MKVNLESTYSPTSLLGSQAKLVEIWKKILNFSFDDGLESRDAQNLDSFARNLAEEAGWTEEFSELAILEYKKFMLLGLVVSPIVPSVHIDTVWHYHLLHTRAYRSFCREALGCDFFHHEPSKGGPVDKEFHQGSFEDTITAYSRVFGLEAPGKVWGDRVRSAV